MIRRKLVGVCALLSVTSCGGETWQDGEQVDSVSEALAPAGSGATLVSTTMKASWYPGERGLVSVTMQNAGTLGAANNWTAPTYALASTDSAWGWSFVRVASVVQTGSSYVFSFVVAAPSAPGAHTFNARMQAIGGGVFGDPVSVPVTVSTASPRQRGCTFVPGSSSLPTSLLPNENRVVTVTVQNSGTDPWASTYGLSSLDVPRNLWGQTVSLLGSAVAPGASKSLSFAIRAPATPGNYRFVREMSEPSLGLFQASDFCIDVPITVSGVAQNLATVASQTFPTVMAPGETTTVIVSMNNTGAETWPADGSVALTSRNNPVNLWGTTSVPVSTSTAANAAASFTFNITAPLTPGSYSHLWSMRRSSGVFGEVVNVPVTVSTSATPKYGATVRSISFPASMTPGVTYPVSIAMKNTGSQPWQGGTFGLRSVSAPANLWGTTLVLLPAAVSVAPGAEYTFSFVVKAPSDVSLSSPWRMSQPNGIGNFGPVVTAGATARDCAQQLSNNPSSTNGVYRIDVDGSGPTAPFDVYCDMTRGGWTQVNDQDIHVGGGYRSIAAWLAGVNITAPNGGQWGVLNHLAAFTRTGGGYELRLTYGQDEARFATWVQTNSPLTNNAGTITGLAMTPANQSGCGAFNGLIRDAGNSALDGNSGGCWWFAVGSQSQFGAGIPAYETSFGGPSLVTDRIRLYVRR